MKKDESDYRELGITAEALSDTVGMASNLTRDRLSNLPDGVIEKIFSSMSIGEVVRTSILSTKWRYKWISNPYLIFNDKCIRNSFGSVAHCKFVGIINRVLLTHRGPILTFKISSSRLKTCPEINSWILSLTSDSLTELEVQMSRSSHPYSVPLSLFSFKHLIHLTLTCCMIPLPPSAFNGFRCLTSLSLKYVRLSDATLDCLLSSCLELENLALVEIGDATRIQLSNPKLKYVHIYGTPSIDTLVCCVIQLRCLTSLCFNNVTLSDATMECLLSSCPELEELTLVEIKGLTCIQLSNPKLKKLSICGDLFSLKCGLEDLKNLVSANFSPRGITHPYRLEDCNFGYVLRFLLGIEKLCLGDFFLQCVPSLDVPRMLSFTYHHLRTIDIALNVVDMQEISAAICLLNRSPNLRGLIIAFQHVEEVAVFPVINLREVGYQFQPSFNELLIVTIYSFHGTEVEWIITRFILANSPLLERMDIFSDLPDREVLNLSKGLLMLRRASPLAIIELGP